MSPKNFILLRPRFCGLVLMALAAWRAQAQWSYPYDPDWARTFRAGVLVGFNISADFSISGSFGISSAGAGIYDDGYLRRDDGGALTSDWGYNNDSQYNSGSQTLTLRKSTAFSTSSSASVKDSASVGLDLAYGGTLWRGQRLRFGWELGFGLLPLKISDNSILTATVSRQAYTFDASGIIIPPAGYHGTPNSAAAKISSAPNLPLAAPEITRNVKIIGSRTIDANFFAIKLGPTLFWDLNRSIGVSIGAGPALGIVTGNLKFDETLNFSGGSTRNLGETGSTDLTYGGYVNGMITFHTVKNGDFYIGAQYMPMGKVKMGSGGRQAGLDLRGQIYVSAGINWPF